MQANKVLICGAGPTGLVLALWLSKAGVLVRVIDKADKPGTTSRATVVHARTLEFYRQLGIHQTAIERGVPFVEGNLWVNGRCRVTLPFGDAGRHVSNFSYILVLPQDLHEEMLSEKLAELGVQVERSTELLSFEETETGIRAKIRTKDGAEEFFNAAYLAGCDGAHSVVRHQLGIGFPGGAYENIFYVADLKIKGALANGKLNAAVDQADFLLVFPMLGEGRVRLIGAIRESALGKSDFQWSDVSSSIMERLKMEVEEIYWFSTYHVHHRVADHFRKGRAFLLGDAGHIHSPVGGQGMNTGIGDAINLAWKLAAVLKDAAPDKVLDTYEPERIAFARELVAATDRIFTFVDKRSAFASFIRTRIAPYLFRFLFGFESFRHMAFKRLSQTLINYRSSVLSDGRSGRIHSGDRLPWLGEVDAAVRAPDNYEPLGERCWQIHVYGLPIPALQQLCEAHQLSLHTFPWSEKAKTAGMPENAVYLIRPDGYIGLAAQDTADPAQLEAYIRQWNIGTA